MFSVFYINFLILLFVFSMIAKAIEAVNNDILNANYALIKTNFFIIYFFQKSI